jgi:hypothetical protein
MILTSLPRLPYLHHPLQMRGRSKMKQSKKTQTTRNNNKYTHCYIVLFYWEELGYTPAVTESGVLCTLHISLRKPRKKSYGGDTRKGLFMCGGDLSFWIHVDSCFFFILTSLQWCTPYCWVFQEGFTWRLQSHD